MKAKNIKKLQATQEDVARLIEKIDDAVNDLKWRSFDLVQLTPRNDINAVRRDHMLTYSSVIGTLVDQYIAYFNLQK